MANQLKPIAEDQTDDSVSNASNRNSVSKNLFPANCDADGEQMPELQPRVLIVCSKKKCPISDPTVVVLLCHFNGQGKHGEVFLHASCYKNRYVKILARQNDASYVIPYNEDGPGGKDDPVSTYTIIVDWMTTGDNFQRYCGDTKEGKTKLRFGDKIATICCKKGCRQEC